MTNVLPVDDSTIRAWAQDAHSPDATFTGAPMHERSYLNLRLCGGRDVLCEGRGSSVSRDRKCGSRSQGRPPDSRVHQIQSH